MARADRRSVKRSRTHAAERSHQRDSDLRAIEDTMFFTRLRAHAKWMFVFLALVFGVGFVGFGIGANQNASIGDLLRGGGGTSGGNVSVSDAREQVQKSPKSAQALRTLSTALQEDGQTDEAIVVLNRYLALRPKDRTPARARRPPPRRATRLRADAQARSCAPAISPSARLRRRSNLGKGATIGPTRSTQAISTQATQAVSRPTKAQTASSRPSRPTSRLVRSPRAIRTSSSSSRRRRSRAATTEGDRRVPELPRARARRPERRSSSSRSRS
jgi:hypothetical protein